MNDPTSTPRAPVSFAVYQHPRYAHHLNMAMMIRQRNVLRHQSPVSSYLDLAVYVCDGLHEFDPEDFLCRLLAVFKCEGNALPTLTHVQSIMALVWDAKPAEAKDEELRAVCSALFDFMYEEFSDQFMLSMKTFAAALKVTVEMESINDRHEPPEPPRPDRVEGDPPPAFNKNLH